jgi:hypothetical protein
MFWERERLKNANVCRQHKMSRTLVQSLFVSVSCQRGLVVERRMKFVRRLTCVRHFYTLYRDHDDNGRVNLCVVVTSQVTSGS